MNIRQLIYILIIGITISCNSVEKNNSHGHDHGPHGHSHGPSQPRTDQTVWTDKSELFVEYPVLVVGKSSRFATHFTQMKNHLPIKEGQLKVTLSNSSETIETTVNKPASIGIFKPTLKPKKSGIYTLTFEVNTPNFQDKIQLENIQVFNSVKEAKAVYGKAPEEDKGITFLKEQAWKMDFQTVPVKEDYISEVVKTSGIWKTPASNQNNQVATTKGIVNYQLNHLTKGMSVTKGQVLMTITSKNLTDDNLQAEIAKAKTQFNTIEQTYSRKKTLYNKQIISKSEFEKIEEEFLLRKTNYETLIKGYSVKGKQIKAPITGVLNEIYVQNGDFVNEGHSLFTISKNNKHLLEAFISPSTIQTANQISNVWYQPKKGKWSSINQTQGKIQSLSQSVDTEHPMLSVFAQVNEPVTQPKGSYTEVHIATGPQTTGLVIPEEALLEDYGQYSVIVQLSGELFERRNVSLGRQNGNLVEIVKGLSKKDVVVTTGAYQVKMASMSGQAPAHGHAH